MKYPYMAEFAKMLVEHMEKGFSFDTFPAVIRYPKHVIDNWLINKPSFAEAKSLGENARTKTLQAMLLTKEINLETYKFLTENADNVLENAIQDFDENILIQARERFGK